MKFKAIIETRTGEKIILELNCREYHAQKLQYVFSRTLDRSVYMDAHVVACDAVNSDAVNSNAGNIELEYKKYVLGLKNKVKR